MDKSRLLWIYRGRGPLMFKYTGSRKVTSLVLRIRGEKELESFSNLWVSQLTK